MTYPAQPVAPQVQAPPQGYAPQGHPPPGYAAAAARKKKIILIAGIGVAALALVLVLVLVLGGGGGGRKDPKDLFQSAFAAAQKGDVDGLMAMDVSSKAGSVMSCEPKKGRHSYDDDEFTPEGMAKSNRKQYARHIDDWKDVTVTVASADEHGDPHVTEPGKDDDLGPCKLTTEVTSQSFDVKVKVKSKDGDDDDTLRLDAIKIDGLWYLSELPSAPGGDKSKMKKFKNRMCDCEKDKDPSGCADKVSKEYEDWSKTMAEKYKDKRPEDIDKGLIEAATAYSDCEMKAKMAGMGSGN